MNCRDFQEQLFEFLDGALPARATGAAERHVAGCKGCRELLAQHRCQSETLVRHLQQAAQELSFSAEARKRLATKLLNTPQKAPRLQTPYPFKSAESFIRRLLDLGARPPWGWAAAAGVLVGILLLGRVCQELTSRTPAQPAPSTLLSSAGQGMSITGRIPRFATTYTFRRDGQFVTDSLVTRAELKEVLVASHLPARLLKLE